MQIMRSCAVALIIGSCLVAGPAVSASSAKDCVKPTGIIGIGAQGIIGIGAQGIIGIGAQGIIGIGAQGIIGIGAAGSSCGGDDDGGAVSTRGIIGIGAEGGSEDD